METAIEWIVMAGMVLPSRNTAGDAAEGWGFLMNNLEAIWRG